jgi:hypothetical protein
MPKRIQAPVHGEMVILGPRDSGNAINDDFACHQQFIKPALIGLIGAWNSCGIEGNVPHHLRDSTFSPAAATAAGSSHIVAYANHSQPDHSRRRWRIM